MRLQSSGSGGSGTGGKRFDHTLDGADFSVGTWACACTHERPGGEQCEANAVINVVTRGAYVRHIGRARILVDPTVAVVSPPGEVWRSSHLPRASGDAGIYVLLAPDRLRRAPERIFALSGARWLDWARLTRISDRANAIELATALVAELVCGDALPAREPEWVERARRLLSEHRRDPPALDALAADLRLSPWHLCRAFRAATGLTPRAYAERLVLADAVAQIESGCTDLATLAHELGFSSHSHLTARFRKMLGRTPRAGTARS